jgi:hypothetical protein
MLDAGVDLRGLQIAAREADARTATRDKRVSTTLDRYLDLRGRDLGVTLWALEASGGGRPSHSSRRVAW